MTSVATIMHHALTGVVVYQADQPVIEISGRDRADLLHRLSSNAILQVPPGRAISTCFLTPKGRILDRVLLLVLPELILALPSAGGADRLMKWIDQFVFLEHVALAESEGRPEVFSFLGPGGPDLVRQVFGIHPAAGSFEERQIGRLRMFVVMGEGSTRVDCIVAGRHDEPVALPDAGIVPRLGERMYTTYRTLTGIPAYGHELSESYNPLEVGLASTINFKKGCYTGQEVIARLDAYNKVRRTLAGVLLPATADTRTPQRLTLQGSGEEAGEVTTISEEIMSGVRTGLAVVRNDLCATDPAASFVVTESGLTGMLYPVPASLGTITDAATALLQSAG